ncbi:MAG: TRASH domain protein [Thermodesulfobacteriota bacterium]
MNPIRILILIILFYILFRLLIGGKKRSAKKSPKGGQQTHDVLVEDPICKTCIPKKQAFVLSDNGESVYFCSAECRDKYQANKGE